MSLFANNESNQCFNVNEESIANLLLSSFTSHENSILENALKILSTLNNKIYFYEILFKILLNEDLDINIRFSSILYIKNVINSKWDSLPDDAHSYIANFFYQHILLYNSPTFIPYFSQLSDLLSERVMKEIDWGRLINQYITVNPISALIIARSLLINGEKYELYHSGILNFLCDYILNMFSNNTNDNYLLTNQCIKILKIIMSSYLDFHFDENHLIVILNFLLNHLSSDILTKSIDLISKICEKNSFLIERIEIPFITYISSCINIPKVSIHFFFMLSIFAKNQNLWSQLHDSFLQFFIPFFQIDELESFEDYSQFICEHHFDSFSSHTDPKSASFRCLEVIGQYQQKSALLIISHLVEILKKHHSNELYNGIEKDLYMFAHMSSALLKSRQEDELTFLFDLMFPLLDSDSTLLKCSALVTLESESYFTPNMLHAQKVIQLLLDSNELVQYFSINFCIKVIPSIHDIEFKKGIPINDIIPKVLYISHRFGLPQYTDLLSYLAKDKYFIPQIEMFAVDLIKSIFSLYQELVDTNLNQRNNNSLNIMTISSLINLIIVMISNFRDSYEIENNLCKIAFFQSVQMLQNNYLSITIPLFELLNVSLYYSPHPFEEMWTIFDIILPLLGKVSSAYLELCISSLTIVLYKNINCINEKKNIITDAAYFIMKEFDVNEFSTFAALLVKYSLIPMELINILISKLYMAWINDNLDFVDDIYELFASLFMINTTGFLEVFGPEIHEFINNLEESAGPKDLILIIPLVSSLMPLDQRNSLISTISSFNIEEILRNEYTTDFEDMESGIQLPKIHIFSDSYIIEAYQSYLSRI